MRVNTTDATTASLAASGTVDTTITLTNPDTAEVRAVRVTSGAPAGTTGTAKVEIGYIVGGTLVVLASATTANATTAIDASFTNLQLPADSDTPVTVRVTNGVNAALPNVRVITVSTDTVSIVR